LNGFIIIDRGSSGHYCPYPGKKPEGRTKMVVETRVAFMAALVQSGIFAEALGDPDRLKRTIWDIYELSGEIARCLREPWDYEQEARYKKYDHESGVLPPADLRPTIADDINARFKYAANPETKEGGYSVSFNKAKAEYSVYCREKKIKGGILSESAAWDYVRELLKAEKV
jgi:hypothetical protein